MNTGTRVDLGCSWLAPVQLTEVWCSGHRGTQPVKVQPVFFSQGLAALRSTCGGAQDGRAESGMLGFTSAQGKLGQ